MKIFYPENLFKRLKDNNTTLTTIDGVAIEFLKGSKNEQVYARKNEHIEDIIDVKLPPLRDNNDHIITLIKLYEADGGNVEIVDYHLGANLIKYKSNLFLMTRNVKDFPQRIFTLISTVSFASVKTVFTYGIYSYTKQLEEENLPDDIPF